MLFYILILTYIDLICMNVDVCHSKFQYKILLCYNLNWYNLTLKITRGFQSTNPFNNPNFSIHSKQMYYGKMEKL